MTADEYIALTEVGIIGKVELIDGVPTIGQYPLVFSADQVRAAADLGIDLSPHGHSART
jgi:hypothetical protein